MSQEDDNLPKFYFRTPYLQFTKVRDVKSPERGTEESAGLDFFIPNELESIRIPTHGSALIPTGIHINIPKGWALIANDKSGVATKKGLKVGAKIVDSDYQGEIHMHVFNLYKEPALVSPGEKLVQFLLVPVALVEPEEIQSLGALYEQTKSERGTGGFGSTGNGIETD